MQSWNLRSVETSDGSRTPIVLDSEEAAARVVLIGLEPGQELGEHEVEEHALVLVLEGSAEIEAGRPVAPGRRDDARRLRTRGTPADLELGRRAAVALPGAVARPGHFRGDERAASAAG
jgi:hypothetical protein